MPSAVHWLIGLLVSGILAAVAYGLRSLDGRGALAGILVGASVYGGFGIMGFGLLALFFVLGSGATRLAAIAKPVSRSERKAGVRTVRHVLANGLVAAGSGAVAAAFPEMRPSLAAAFAGSLAAATADTLSSEVGQIYGGRPFLLTTFRRVAAGENGGITVVGTLAGVLGATAIAATALRAGLVTGIAAILLAGIAGNLIDSLLGATLERRGLLTNAGVNLGCTLTGAVCGIVLARVLSAF